MVGTGSPGGLAGRGPRASISPTSSVHRSPALHPRIPIIKLNLRSHAPTASLSTKHRSGRSPPSDPRRGANGRNGAADQRRAQVPQAFKRDEDSDLTPVDDDDDDEGEGEEGDDVVDEAITPRQVKKGRTTPTQALQHHIAQVRQSAEKEKRQSRDEARVPPKKRVSLTQSGPDGRKRKRAVKLGEVERRRARDEKFAVETDGFSGLTPAEGSSHTPGVFTYEASEMGHEHTADTYSHGTDDESMQGLPEAFAGQEIEDLGYGNGPAEIETQRQVLSGFWNDEEEEDDEMFISQLSGSENEHRSVSSAHDSEEQSAGSETEASSTTEDEVDEFGFPMPSAPTLVLGGEPPAEVSPLILMENWDGQFVLVQTRQDRSFRRRDSRGSRTNASIDDRSTIISAADQQGLIIDVDAAEHEFDADNEDSFWSDMTDDEDGGDTTDSMEEDEMPMLDSPSLSQMIADPLAVLGMGLAVNGSSAMELLFDEELLSTGPSIVVTDMSTIDTTALSLPISTPGLSPLITTPQTPITTAPIMGTFHPATDDPAQHAVIDGSKTATKSPFTHRRRPARGRNSASVTSTAADDRKRKIPSIYDPFTASLPKKARYSSIPGHPRFIAARQQETTEQERETTPSDDESPIELEDIFESHVLGSNDSSMTSMTPQNPDRHFRFDRVPVSTYLRRNFGVGAARSELPLRVFSSPIDRGIDGAPHRSLDATLAGGGLMISPILAPTGEDEGTFGRRDKRHRRRNMESLRI